MVVQNISGKDLKIPEIRSIVPADGKKYIVPYEVAIKYKQYLKPIQLSDLPFIQEQVSDDPISNQIAEMNANAVENLNILSNELRNELKLISNENEPSYDEKTKFDLVKSIWENNPDFTIKRIAQFADVSYSFVQRTLKKLKKQKD
jgi:hypothetical protein